MRLKLLSRWALAAAISAGCATSEEPDGMPKAGSKGDAGEGGDEASGGKGGSSAGTATTGGSLAGSNKGGSSVGGDTPVGGTDGAAGEPSSAGQGGMGPEAGGGMNAAGAGGADPGCAGPDECDDQNPCTDDACNEAVCEHTANTDPCAADQDDCTDDVCVAGKCEHPENTAPCEDDNDACTNDLCNSGGCTHPANGTCMCQNAQDCDDSNGCTNDACVGNQCVYTNNTLACADDGNPCTNDACMGGSCKHPNNSKSCTDDGDACTGDVCLDGQCTHPAVANCCSGDGDCFDNNVCTDESCVNHACVFTNNTGSCAADPSPCTLDKCGAGQCGHPSNAVCSGADDVVIFSNRGSRYVVLSGTNLDWSGTAQGSAEVFEKVGEAGSRFKLRAKSSGLFVALGVGDVLVASADQAGGMTFDAPTCGAQPWVGLSATTDTNGGSWVASDDTAGTLRLIARSADCGAASATSWEKFQLRSVTKPCSVPADCNDGNVCTDDACTAGFCVYADHAGTCDDDASSCTDDVCNSGSCTHPGNGTCAGPLVTILANRNGKYVVLNTSFLEYTADSTATAEKFELVDAVGTQFKLRAQSNASFVTLDLTDNLIANTNFAGAMLFDAPVCGALVGLNATSDDDAQKWVAADALNRLVARSGGCPAADANSWEKFTLVPE